MTEKEKNLLYGVVSLILPENKAVQNGVNRAAMLTFALLCLMAMGAWVATGCNNEKKSCTVTLYRAAESGMGYDEGEVIKVAVGQSFELPAIRRGDIETYMMFEGWLQGPAEAPATWETTTDGRQGHRDWHLRRYRHPRDYGFRRHSHRHLHLHPPI